MRYSTGVAGPGGIKSREVQVPIAAAAETRGRDLGRVIVSLAQARAARTLVAPFVASHRSFGDWDCARPVDVNAHRALPRLAKEFFAAGTVTARAHPDYERLHQFRLLAKRFRYTLEMFEPVFGPEIARGVKELRGLQDKLGAVNDCITALSLIAANPDAVAAIEKLLAGREIALRSYWRERFDSRQQAWWLDWLSRSSIETKPDAEPAKKQIARESRPLHARKNRAA